MKSINKSLAENCMPHIHYLNNVIDTSISREQNMYKRNVFLEINSVLALIKTKVFDSLDFFMIDEGTFRPREQ
jgi:hypothetical protein